MRGARLDRLEMREALDDTRPRDSGCDWIVWIEVREDRQPVAASARERRGSTRDTQRKGSIKPLRMMGGHGVRSIQPTRTIDLRRTKRGDPAVASSQRNCCTEISRKQSFFSFFAQLMAGRRTCFNLMLV